MIISISSLLSCCCGSLAGVLFSFWALRIAIASLAGET